MHIHITTMGEKIDPILKGFKLIPGIEKTYILYSGKYPESVKKVESFLHSGNMESKSIKADEYDFQDVMEKISSIVEQEKASGSHTYSINVTGGTKLMAFAAYSSAYFIGATVYYIQDRDDIPLSEQLLTILTTKAPKNTKSDKKGREILKFIYEKTLNNGTVSNQDIEVVFGMKKQQVSYYIKNLRESGLITTDPGVFDVEKQTMNYRYNSIRLTQQGQMEAKFTKGA